MGITEKYLDYQRHFEEKYGESVVVLIQIGKFYECYEYISSLDGQSVTIEGNAQLKFSQNRGPDESLGKAVEISRLLNMKLTSKDKGKPHGMNNPLMMGFPPPNYTYHRDVILMHGYTVVKVDQKENGGKDVEREVTEVVSPGTGIDTPIQDSQPTKTSCIVSLYFELKKAPLNRPEKAQLLCGLSSIDVTTGKSLINEIYSQENNESYAIEETYRFLNAQRPVDIIIHIKGNQELTLKYQQYLNEQLELDRYPTKIVKCNQLDLNFQKDVYQEAVLGKAFESSQSNNYIYDLDLELFYYGRISYIVLLQYCYEHNETLIKRLQKPHVGWSDEEKYLILAHDTAEQLNFFPLNSGLISQRRNAKEHNSLISVIDQAGTAIGSRYLRRALLNPITDIKELNMNYEMTAELIATPDLLEQIDLLLKQLPDIERLQRKVQIGVVKPQELVALFTGYRTFEGIYRLIFQACCEKENSLSGLLMTGESINEFNDTMQWIRSEVDFENLKQVKLTVARNQSLDASYSFVKPGIHQKLDQVETGLRQCTNWFEMICQHLNELLTGTRGKGVEIIRDRQDGNINKIRLQTTSAKAKQLQRSQVDPQLCGQLQYQTNRSKSELTSEVINQVVDGITFCQKELEEQLLIYYNQLVSKLSESTFFEKLTQFIGKLDFLKSNAQMALKYNYFRPMIDEDATEAHFEIQDGRHPLVERIINAKYITNDLMLGKEELGLLLYGVNSSGKSCFAKMVATNIVMAQAGFYVPAQLKYHPFTKIITRLTTQDDMIKGRSSFVVEATEIRSILRSANQNTLVLGDELCSTTETGSGTGIAGATIKTMISRNIKFIFATHMHHLPKVGIIKEQTDVGCLKIAHLTATYDPTEDRLIYGRKIAKGQGSSQYGLEVCKSLGFDRDFLDEANRIRRETEQTPEFLMSTKTSRYNSRVYVDQCSICKTHLNLQTHHLKEQREADERGFIEHYHKNAAFNLLVLCQKCHQEIHQVSSKQTLAQQ
jgi:DNA mismatch repair protein MutS